MNIRTLSVSVLAAVLALSLAGTGTAWADGGRHHGRHDYGHHGKHKKYKRGHHGRSHYKGHRGRYSTHYYEYDDDDDHEKLLIGLVVGGLIGYAINNAQQEQAYEYEPPGYGGPRPGGHDPSCLQEREYQTRVIVGGKEVPAYGTACLQPDGSWRRGPARVTNY